MQAHEGLCTLRTVPFTPGAPKRTGTNCRLLPLLCLQHSSRFSPHGSEAAVSSLGRRAKRAPELRARFRGRDPSSLCTNQPADDVHEGWQVLTKAASSLGFPRHNQALLWSFGWQKHLRPGSDVNSVSAVTGSRAIPCSLKSLHKKLTHTQKGRLSKTLRVQGTITAFRPWDGKNVLGRPHSVLRTRLKEAAGPSG